MASTALRTDPPDPSLLRWSEPDAAANCWPPPMFTGGAWDRDLERLLVVADDPAFSVVHLVPAAGGPLVRRAVHGFSDEASASQHAVENGWRDFAVRATPRLPRELLLHAL